MKNRIIELAMACILLIGAVFLPQKAVESSADVREPQAAQELETGMTGEVILPESNQAQKLPEGEIHKVVLDAGHGGNDPGKIGINGVLEKDINLSIVKMLKEELEAAGIEVVLTRQEDSGLYQETDGNKKQADMKGRCAVIEEANPEVVISIHQNSYHQSNVKGPQVFYYTGSEKGKNLAEMLQDSFTEVIGKKNTRSVKSNSQYYLLLHVKQPIVIVECGFLSNQEEADLLKSEEYQRKIAASLRGAVVSYFLENQ